MKYDASTIKTSGYWILSLGIFGFVTYQVRLLFYSWPLDMGIVTSTSASSALSAYGLADVCRDWRSSWRSSSDLGLSLLPPQNERRSGVGATLVVALLRAGTRPAPTSCLALPTLHIVNH
jgi:hypothetical protein